jgi:hypothetical protein
VSLSIPGDDQGTREVVASALEYVAAKIRAGVREEEIAAGAWDEPVLPADAVDITLFMDIVQDVCEEMVAQRDHGSRTDRAANRVSQR